MPPLDDDDDQTDNDLLPQSVQDAPDEDPPFSPATPGPADATDPDDASMAGNNIVDDTHPDTDDGMEDQERYDAGDSAASGANEPNAGNTVIGYDPTNDHRRDA